MLDYILGMNAGAGGTPQAAIGVLRLQPESVQRALTDQALGLLLPPTLHLWIQPPNHTESPELSTPRDQWHSAQPSADQMASSQTQRSEDLVQAHQLSSSSSQQLSQQSSQQLRRQSSERLSQQSSQKLRQQAWGESRQGRPENSPEWRQLSGGPEGAGFGGNRGTIWAVVAAVGSLIPINMQVGAMHSCIKQQCSSEEENRRLMSVWL